MKEHELVTAQTLAEAIGLSVETIWRYTREKRIPFMAIGNRQYRYRLAEVVASLSNAQMQESPADYQAERDRKMTYDDYRQLSEEPGFSFEVLDGMLVRDPSPAVAHQRVLVRLLRMLSDYFSEADPAGEVLIAPLDVTIGQHTVLQPDLLYLTGDQQHQVLLDRIDGPPTLVVEIISPSTRRKDRLRKLQIYRQAQVPHYWLVDPEERTLQCFALRDDTYAVLAGGMDDDVIDYPDFPGLTVNLHLLWP